MGDRRCMNCGAPYSPGASGASRGRCPACYQFWRRSGGLDHTARRMESVLVAWEAGELSEGQAARLLGMDRVALRGWRQEMLERAAALWVARGSEKAAG